MFSKAKIAVSAVIVLSAAFPASAATKHHPVTHVHRAIYNMVPHTVGGGCPANGGPGCNTEGQSAPPDRD
jgi:predicted amidohydrolase